MYFSLSLYLNVFVILNNFNNCQKVTSLQRCLCLFQSLIQSINQSSKYITGLLQMIHSVCASNDIKRPMSKFMRFQMSIVMKCQESWHADADAGYMTPSSNTQSYTLRSEPSSPGRSFFFTCQSHIGQVYKRGLIHPLIE